MSLSILVRDLMVEYDGAAVALFVGGQESRTRLVWHYNSTDGNVVYIVYWRELCQLVGASYRFTQLVDSVWQSIMVSRALPKPIIYIW